MMTLRNLISRYALVLIVSLLSHSRDAQDTPLPRIATPQKSIEEDDGDADFKLEEKQVVRG